METIIDGESGRKNGVTIGIPVYNEEERIERAVRSAVGQCERLLVADNASNDDTELICRRLLLEFPNMDYKRHEKNVGALENFHSLLSLTTSPFFMFLGSHDYIGPRFIETLKKALDDDPEILLCAGGLFYNQANLNSEDAPGDEAFNNWRGGEQAESSKRVRSLLYAEANLPWAMYGLFRTSVLRDLFNRDLPIHGVDLVFLAKVASHGKIVISKGAKYHAWVRPGSDSRSNYVSRLVGNQANKHVQRSMRNKSRLAIHSVLVSSEQPSTFGKELVLRYRTMARFGVFKNPGYDAAFFLFYIPAKLALATRRLNRSTKRLIGKILR